MPLEPFDRICSEIARAERHACDVNSPALGVPLGTYVLRAFKTCRNFGDHLQYSVFECDLNPAEKIELETGPKRGHQSRRGPSALCLTWTSRRRRGPGDNSLGPA